MILTRRRSISAVYIEDISSSSASSSSSVELPPPKRLKVPTRRRRRTKSITNKSPATSRLVKVTPPPKKQVSTISTTPSEWPPVQIFTNTSSLTSQLEIKRPFLSISGATSLISWLPDGWTVEVRAVSTGHKCTVFKENATGKIFFSKPQVLNYLAIADSSNSNKRYVKVAPPKEKQVSAITTSGGTYTLPDGWTVVELAKAAGQKYKVFKETATGKKFYSKPQVLKYLGYADSSNSNERKVKVTPPQKELEVSTISTTPSEIPKDLYDLIHNAFKARESLKRNPDNRFAKRKLEDYERQIHRRYLFYRFKTEELPSDWRYNPKTSFMAIVPKPTPPPEPKTQKEEKNKEEEEKKERRKKKEIKITWSSPNYHGSYPLNDDYAMGVWNEFIMKDTAEARDHLSYPIDKFLNMVDKDHKVVDLLGRFAVDTFNRSCQMYVNKDEANQVSGAEFMECKFYKLPKTYIFYMTMEAIEQGIPGVYETKVRSVTKTGATTLMNFKLTAREPKWNKPGLKPREAEVEYETVQDGSSDPQDFYELTGLVHRDREETKGGGFNYHNPIYSTHRIICNLSEDKKSRDFVPNVSQPPSTTKTIPMDS